MLNRQKTARGFTIVELLIVIVVIAILAAISIVAYNGIQNRSKTSAGQQLAAQVAKKIEAINAVKGTYFSGSAAGKDGAAINTLANTAPVVSEAVVDTPASVVAASGAAAGISTANANNGSAVAVWGCPNGANVLYYNYTDSTIGTVKAGAGC